MNPWEKNKPPSDPKVIEEEAFKKASKSSKKVSYKGRIITAREREIKRIKVLASVIEKHLKNGIRILENYFDSNEFYRDIIKLFFPEDDIKRILKRFRGLVKLFEDLKKEYISQIKMEKDLRQLSKIRREAQGRIASLLKSASEDIRFIIKLYNYAKKLPSLDLDIPTFIIAGPPNAGKSSLINAISTAKVKTASYPFTTKDIHLGHFKYNYIIIQLIDTPGLLDRALPDKNAIEMQAILAFKHLKGPILFLFDPSPLRYYDIEKQLKIYRDIASLFSDKEIIPIINKIDNIEWDQYKKLVKELGNVLEISVLKKRNLDMLKMTIVKIAQEILLKLE